MGMSTFGLVSRVICASGNSKMAFKSLSRRRYTSVSFFVYARLHGTTPKEIGRLKGATEGEQAGFHGIRSYDRGLLELFKRGRRRRQSPSAEAEGWTPGRRTPSRREDSPALSVPDEVEARVARPDITSHVVPCAPRIGSKDYAEAADWRPDLRDIVDEIEGEIEEEEE